MSPTQAWVAWIVSHWGLPISIILIGIEFTI